jgi:hypothetical protein
VRVEQLEHILRASAEICEEIDFIIVGSQAILGEHPEVTDEVLTRSIECDLYPEFAPEKSEWLNVIGELSPFHATFGYYADGVDETTAVLPDAWKDRRILVTTRTLRDAQVRGWCLETHDLAVAKVVAGRPKDIEYCRTLVRLGYVSREKLIERLSQTRMSAQRKKLTDTTLAIIFRP